MCGTTLDPRPLILKSGGGHRQHWEEQQQKGIFKEMQIFMTCSHPAGWCPGNLHFNKLLFASVSMILTHAVI